MKTKIKDNLKQIPLVILLVVTALLITAVAALQKGGLYYYYEVDMVREPLLAIVFEAAADGTWPWNSLTAPRGGDSAQQVAEILRQREEAEALELLAQQSDAENEKSERATPEEEITTSEAATGEEGAEELSAPAGENSDAAGEGADAREESEEGTEDGGEENVTVATADNEEESGTEAEETEDGERVDPDNPTHIFADSMPEGVCSPVMPAEDYGNCSPRYLAAAGASWAEETQGMFAENGEYYLLREVNDYYLKDALFIGDSRTAGLMAYGGLRGTASFFAKESMNVYNLFDRKVHLYELGTDLGEMGLLQALTTRRYHKVYLSVGVNELGIPTTAEYYQRMREALGVIRQLQPDAIIYICGIMHVSEHKAKSDSAINNTNIVQRNEWIASLANGRDIFYLDMNPALCDENGNLTAEASSDGVHLKASYYALEHEFLLKNAVVRDPMKDFRGDVPEPYEIEESVVKTDTHSGSGEEF